MTDKQNFESRLLSELRQVTAENPAPAPRAAPVRIRRYGRFAAVGTGLAAVVAGIAIYTSTGDNTPSAYAVEKQPDQTDFVVLGRGWVRARTLGRLSHWDGLLRERAGHLDVATGGLACGASPMAATSTTIRIENISSNRLSEHHDDRVLRAT